MSGIGAYLLSIGAAAILCCIVKRLAGERTVTGKIIKMVSGVFLVITVISPVMDFKGVRFYVDDFKISADEVTAEGVFAAKQEQKQIIKQQTEAYILDETKRMGVEVGVCVLLSETDPPYPIQVSLDGNVSPYLRAQLCNWITQSLNISEENIQWT